MTPARRVVSALVATFAVAATACAPSGNAGRAPRVAADSAPDTDLPEAPAETASSVPDDADGRYSDVSPTPAPSPRAPVASRPIYVPRPAGPYRVRVVDEYHHNLPTFASGGRTYVMGTTGSRYAIVVTNPTPRRVEVVLSVDGLDAMDGQAANYVEKRGYILPPYGDTTIDGFRTSLQEVAAFRFSSVSDSYAGRLGQPRDIGVIGAAFFAEQPPIAVAPPPPPRPVDAPRHARAPAPPAQPAKPRYSPPEDDLASNTPPPPAPAAPATRGGGGAGGETIPQAHAERGPAGAEAQDKAESGEAWRRPGLGTEFGEQRESPVSLTEFARANPTHPSQVISIRYNDRAGLVALGVAVPEPYVAAENDLRLRETADPFRSNRFAQPPP
jgi:hypothetical protein